MTSTKDVIDHHLKAFGERDLKGLLSDYAPGVVFFTQHGALRGPDAIRPLFQAMIAEFANLGAAFRMQQQFVEGEAVNPADHDDAGGVNIRRQLELLRALLTAARRAA